MQKMAAIGQKVQKNTAKVLVGREAAVELALVALACEGHLLIEDAPGVGKTMLARALSISLDLDCKRIQFTPDLLPSDITGVSVFNQKSADFEFRPGPVFTNILLADEINRATPRTQAALLECMEERRVTVDGIAHETPRPYMVMATQNPIEYEGTFPLPEAQLDRFMLRIGVGYPDPKQQVDLFERVRVKHPIESLAPVLEAADVADLQAAAREIRVEPSLRRYIADLVEATRRHVDVALGVSPRGAIAFFKAAQALGGLRGRDYAIPEDLKELAEPVLAHRLLLKPESQMRGVDARAVIAQICGEIAVPTEDVLHG